MNDHSTKPDIATGWQQRQLMLRVAKLRQFPLVFMNQSVDAISKSLTSFGNSQIYRVVYMGPRHNSNMKAFKHYCQSQQNNKVNDSQLYGLSSLNRFIFNHSHQSQKFFPIRVSEYRLFTGMNPTFKKDDLRFDSDFQCGNLDLAIYINPVEYDLIMRVDSNTKGHTSWFYFKVSNVQPNQKIKFNIINFNKKYLSYKDGMKPYVFKKSAGLWMQQCISVTYNTRKFRYEGSQEKRSQCLSFFYQFKDIEQVYFAYCIPYSYSYLLHRVQQLRLRAPHLMKISYESESTGGLPIPILTITNFSSSIQKSNALCIARLHPGETQGSWMMDGFMTHLLSPESHYLRDRIIFKIIPMVNVDGVVLGNFRTGIVGRDLNRCFHVQDYFNQINLIRGIATQLNPQTFIDFHGHSAKKNVFIYGPDYRLQHKNYLTCRIFPKLISKQTEAFRYYSCSFNINKSKATTGRAIMLREFKTEFSYTVEASAYAYGPIKNQVHFISQYYQTVGAKIANSMIQFVRILRILPKREQVKIKNQEQQTRRQNQIKRQTKNFTEKTDKSEIQLLKNQENLSNNTLQIDSIESLSIVQKNLLRQILKDQSKIDEEQKQGMSEQSDCEDQSNDYSNTDMKKIMSAKFDDKQKKKQKQLEIKKRQKTKEKKNIQQLSPSVSKKMTQFKPKINFLQNNKSLPKKKKVQQGLRSSETINVMQHYKNNQTYFQSGVSSSLLENNPSFMDGIVQKKQKSRILSDHKQSPSGNSRNNNVHYDWSGHKKQQQILTKNFQFQIPQFLDPVIIGRKKSKDKFQQQQEKKTQKKKNPMLSIKKSILPVLGRSAQITRDGPQKSMLSQILQQHQRKKKAQRNVRIMFL